MLFLVLGLVGCSEGTDAASSTTTGTTVPPDSTTAAPTSLATTSIPSRTTAPATTSTTPPEPELTLEAGLSHLTAPWHAIAVKSPQVVVRGAVTRGASVHIVVTADVDDSVVSEAEAAVTDDYFEGQVELAPGPNTVTVTAALTERPVSEVALGARYEPDATVEFAFLKEVTTNHIVADYAQWLTGEEAAQAAYEDGAIGSVEEGVPNDYYIRNINPRLRTLPLADEVAVWLTTPSAGPVTFVEVELSDWLTLFNDGVPWKGDEESPPPDPPDFGFFGAGREFTPYWLVLIHGEVIAIEQQYIP